MNLKKILILSITLLISNKVISQTADTIEIQYGIEKKVIYSPKKLKKGNAYQIRFKDVHSGIMSLKSEITSYDWVSNTPDVLKILSIESTASLEATAGFKQIDGRASAIEDNLKQNIMQIDRYDRFYRQMLKLIGTNLKSWPEKEINADSLKSHVINISEEVFTITIKKEHVQILQNLLEENELWALYINNLITKDTASLTSLSTFSTFMTKRALLRANASKYIKSILIFDEIINPTDGNKISTLQGDTFTAKGDFTKLKFTIGNKLSADTLAFGAISWPSSNYLTLDFSTGFYWNELTNDSFSLQEYSTDSTTITFRKDYDKKIDLAMGGQLHLSYMVSGSIGVGVNTGAAVSLYDGSTKYLLGGHFKIGNQKQLMLSIGTSIGKVKRVSDVITSDPLFQKSSNTIVVPSRFTEPKLIDKVESSVFIGISYNLSGTLTKRK